MTRLHGQEPVALYRALFLGTLGSAYGFGQVLFKATPLLCTGLSVALAFRAGLFNVGAEGQIIVGALCCALCGAYVPAPAVLLLPMCVLSAFLGGGLLGAFAGFCKTVCRAHEVIVTILMNFLVRAVLVGLGGYLFMRESVHTAPISQAARLPRLSVLFSSLHGSAANLALGLAVALAVIVHFLLSKTRFGFAVRVVGQNPDAAAASGISLPRIQVWAFGLAGGLAGLGGVNFVLGYKCYYEDGFSSGVGYLGIAVAVLAQSRPLWLLVSALFFGLLAQGGLAVAALVPRELIDVLSAVVILVVATAVPEVSRLLPRFAPQTGDRPAPLPGKEGPAPGTHQAMPPESPAAPGQQCDAPRADHAQTFYSQASR